MPPRTIAVLTGERKYKRLKKAAKSAFLECAVKRSRILHGGELFVEERDGLDAAEIILKRDVFVGRVRVLIRQPESEQHAGNLERVVHLSDEWDRATLADEHRFFSESRFKRVNRFLENRMRVWRHPRLAHAQDFEFAMD